MVTKALQGGSLGQLTALEESIGWQYGAVLTGLSIMWKGDHWLAIVKADFRSGPRISYIDVTRFKDGIHAVTSMAEKGILEWSPDKHPPMPKLKRNRWSNGHTNGRS